MLLSAVNETFTVFFHTVKVSFFYKIARLTSYHLLVIIPIVIKL